MLSSLTDLQNFWKPGIDWIEIKSQKTNYICLGKASYILLLNQGY